MAGEVFPLPRCRGHHYRGAAADRKAVATQVATQVNFLLISGAVHQLELHRTVSIFKNKS